MRTASTWLVLAAANAVIWLSWPVVLDEPVVWVVAAVSSALVIAAAAAILGRRDLPAVSLASAAGVAIGWSSTAMPAEGGGLGWSLLAVGVFAAAAVLAALLAGLVVGLRERRAPGSR